MEHPERALGKSKSASFLLQRDFRRGSSPIQQWDLRLHGKRPLELGWNSRHQLHFSRNNEVVPAGLREYFDRVRQLPDEQSWNPQRTPIRATYSLSSSDKRTLQQPSQTKRHHSRAASTVPSLRWRDEDLPERCDPQAFLPPLQSVSRRVWPPDGVPASKGLAPTA
mmetsp:Transcript_125633/g.250692  ORF Transcript_125633/g.250692 Transcript_125633/m.250692 type:complete len:166 (-) Transcript_125633:70-567(-)